MNRLIKYFFGAADLLSITGLRGVCALVLGGVLFASCSKSPEQTETQLSGGKAVIVFSAPTIGGITPVPQTLTGTARQAVRGTRAPLAENTTVRVAIYKAASGNPVVANYVSDQAFYIKGGVLVACTVDAEGKFTAEVTDYTLKLTPGSYDFYAITPALPLGSDQATVSVANGMDYATSLTGGVSINSNQTVNLTELARKCTRITLKVTTDTREVTTLDITDDTSVTLGATLPGTQTVVLGQNITPATGSETISVPAASFKQTSAVTVTAETVVLPKPTGRVDMSYHLTLTTPSGAYTQHITGPVNDIAFTGGHSYTLTLTIHQTGIEPSIEINDWGPDQSGDVATPYPYVNQGAYIVSKDAFGSSAGPFHDPWLVTPAHMLHDANNAVGMHFEVAAEDCNATNTPFVTPDLTPDKYVWANAAVVCSKYAQASGAAGTWRVPTYAELKLIHSVKGNLTVNEFPVPPASSDYYYWSATENSAGYPWIWRFDTDTNYISGTDKNSVRCVRDVGAKAYPYVKELKYIVSKDADGSAAGPFHEPWTSASMPVHDKGSAYDIIGMNFEVARKNCEEGSTIVYNWPTAVIKCSQYTQDNGPSGVWRLPTMTELRLIYAMLGQLDRSFPFPNSTNYWSASRGWCVNFRDFGDEHQPETNGYYTRCVRDVGAKAYPYVSEGKYIVSQDADGSSGEQFHDKWNASPVFYYDYNIPINNLIGANFEVANADGGTSIRVDAAAAACAQYVQEGSVAGTWRVPTFKELQAICDKKGELTVGALKSAKYMSITWVGNYYSSQEFWGINFADGSKFIERATWSIVDNLRCVRDVGVDNRAYPYVVDGKIIVSKTANGAAQGVFHPKWLQTPRHAGGSPEDGLPGEKFEVAADNCNLSNTGIAPDAGTEEYKWEKGITACSKYAQPGSAAGTWRMPTNPELITINGKKDLLPGITAFAYGISVWSATEYDFVGNPEAWTMTIDDIMDTYDRKTHPNVVRCVRDL